MRSVFSWHLFKGYLKEDLSSFEYRFMRKVFAQAALGFGSFGIIVSALAWISTLFQNSRLIDPVLALLALVTGIAFIFYYFPKYKSNPLEVTPGFVRRAYISLIFTYGVIFYMILKVFNLLISVDVQNSGFFDKLQWTSVVVGASFFGVTLLIYCIPAAMGFFMNKHSKAVSLHKFLNICYIAYLVLFLISLATIFIATSSGTQRMIHFLLLVLSGIIIFSSPILSIYRMKTVTKFLDKSDPVAIKKWELFFVYEILAQLMQMAVYLIRLIFYFFMGSFNRRN